MVVSPIMMNMMVGLYCPMIIILKSFIALNKINMDTTAAVLIEIKKKLGIELPNDIDIPLESTLDSLGLDSLDKVEVMLNLENFFNLNLESLYLENLFLSSSTVSDMVSVIEKAILQKQISFKIENNHSLSGAEMITTERNRQISEEGYDKEHDGKHTQEELSFAAICYAMPKRFRPEGEDALQLMGWPLEDKYWKPGNYTGIGDPLYKSERIRELTKAGALIAAEIDRLKNN